MTEDLLHTAGAGFESARRLHRLPEGHRARRPHGHSFLARVRARLPEGWGGFPGGEVDALAAWLAEAVAPLDYTELDEQIELPTDAGLARWLRARPGLPGVDSVGIRSTQHAGVDLDASGHAQLWRRYVFQSAHRLPRVPPGHKCGRMHGHGFEVVLHADQDLGTHPACVDHEHLDALWAPLHARLHHACLNDIPGLENPTSEMLSSWIWERLAPRLPELSSVTVYETGSCGAHFDGQHYRIWKELTLDSAVRLSRAPEGDPRRRIHGHTYTLRLHLHAPLDEVLGWTVDFGDVKSLFAPIFERLDHQPLHELPELVDADTASLARWIRAQAAPLLPQLDRVDLFQSRDSGVILSWGPLGAALPV